MSGVQHSRNHSGRVFAALLGLVCLSAIRPAAAQTDEIQVYDAEITPVGQ
jgi:hypothetical protein